MTIGPVQLLVVSFDKPNFSGESLARASRGQSVAWTS